MAEEQVQHMLSSRPAMDSDSDIQGARCQVPVASGQVQALAGCAIVLSQWQLRPTLSISMGTHGKLDREAPRALPVGCITSTSTNTLLRFS